MQKGRRVWFQCLKNFDKDKWYMTKDVMPDKSLEGWPHGLLLRIEDEKTGEKIIAGEYDTISGKWFDSDSNEIKGTVIAWHVTPVLWVGDEIKAAYPFY